MVRREILLNLLPSVFLFVLTLTIYIITLSQSVYFGDSGEFIAVAKTLGITHPPGYPLYTMLAHLFTYLPFGNLAFRVNLFSAVTSSLTVVIVYFICLKLTRNRIAAISASLFLAFSYLFWLYSLVAEVFSLNALFVALIILISIHIFENPQSKRLFYLLSFVFGLALTNHQTILFLTPALLFLILSTNPKLLLNPRFIILNTLFIILGLLPYLYLPLRASQNPILTWGEPDTFKGFFDYVARRTYGTFSLGALSKESGFTSDATLFYLKSLFKYFNLIGPILAFLGFLITLKNRKIFSFLFLAFLFLGPVFILFSRSPVQPFAEKGTLERFFLASIIPLIIWFSLGLIVLINTLQRYLGILSKLLVLIFLLPLFLNFSKVDQSKNTLFENFGREIFEILPQNAIFLVSTDEGLMSSTYLQLIQNQRPDIKIVNYTQLTKKWYQDNLKQRYPDLQLPWEKFNQEIKSHSQTAITICNEIVANNPTFLDFQYPEFQTPSNNACSYKPFGTLISLGVPESKLSDEGIARNYDFWQPKIDKLKQNNSKDIRTRTVLVAYSRTLTYFGASLADLGKTDQVQRLFEEAYQIAPENAVPAGLLAQKFYDEKNFNLALDWATKALAANPTYEPAHRILGFIYLDEKNDKKKAYYHFQKYLNLAPQAQDRDQIQTIVEKIRKEL